MLRERTNEVKWHKKFPQGSVACRQPTSKLRWILRSPFHKGDGRSPRTSSNLDWFHYCDSLWIYGGDEHKAPRKPMTRDSIDHQEPLPMSSTSTKPARWWQSSRVTRNPESQRPPSATKCNLLVCNALDHSQPQTDAIRKLASELLSSMYATIWNEGSKRLKRVG